MTFTVKLTAENEALKQGKKDLELKISALTAGNKSLKQSLKEAVRVFMCLFGRCMCVFVFACAVYVFMSLFARWKYV